MAREKDVRGGAALELEEQERGGPLTGETPPTPKKRKKWPVFAAIALILGVLAGTAGYAAANWVALTVRFAPLYALGRSVSALTPPPQPMSLGLLGQVTVKGFDVDCSGTLDVQSRGDGLYLSLRELTLGGEGLAVTVSGYLSPHDVALSAPSLTGGSDAFYGVSLDETILAQAKGTGGDPEYGWYFNDAQIENFQATADMAKEALSAVEQVGLTGAEQDAVREFVTGLDLAGTRAGEGYVLTAQAADGDIRELCGALALPVNLFYGSTALTFSLNGDGTLCGVEVDSQGADFRVDLGNDPAAELAPRLEATLPGGESAITLAAMVSQGGEVVPPDYQNAFELLPYIPGAEKNP